MRGAGIYMAIFGLAGLILPEFGFQLRLLNIFGRNSTAIAGILMAVGVILFIVSLFTPKKVPEEQKNEAETKEDTETLQKNEE